MSLGDLQPSIITRFKTPSYLICLLFSLNIVVVTSESILLNYTVNTADSIAVGCGFFGNSIGLDGRVWVGDSGSVFISSGESTTAQASGLSAAVPYKIARIFRSPFTYTFQVNPGPKIIRLHFNPASYPGFERSRPLFSVKTGHYTLVSHFSGSPNSSDSVVGSKSFFKEFVVKVQANQVLDITFSPSPTSTSTVSEDIYGFINGIEIVSMPSSLYYTPAGSLGAPVVGHNHHFYIDDSSTALEMVQRLNIGGSSISPVHDSVGLFRAWLEDTSYLLNSAGVTLNTTAAISYTKVPTYTAPPEVYQTARSNGPNRQATNQMYNLSWKLPVDLGFRYLVRLHFCEFEEWLTKSSDNRAFDVLINNEMAEANADVIKWSGGNGVAVYKDYVAMMEGDRTEGKRDILISIAGRLNRNLSITTHPILNGLELFKLSNPDNNLAGVNPSSASVQQTTWSSNKTSKGIKVALVFVGGILIGVVAITLLLGLCGCNLRWRSIIIRRIFRRSRSFRLTNGYRLFSLAEIRLATNNFNEAYAIGVGGFGTVYRGCIPGYNGSVAIKRLNVGSRQGSHEFWTEIRMLTTVRHTNLVSLLGYCDDNNEMILIYEYMANGSLADHLYNKNNSNSKPRLSWRQRLHICLCAAHGLDYLHRVARQKIIHRDVKPSNILLDDRLLAKLSDFGLSKLGPISGTFSHLTTIIKGTLGYLDPEYFMTQKLTRKSDVYAFGVVMFEVLCGRRVLYHDGEQSQRNLAMWALQCLDEGTLEQIIDPHLSGQISPQCLKVFTDIARKCLHELGSQRPTMFEVVANLDIAIMLLDGEPRESDVVINVGTDIPIDPLRPQIRENVDSTFRFGDNWSNDEQTDESFPLFSNEIQMVPMQPRAPVTSLPRGRTHTANTHSWIGNAVQTFTGTNLRGQRI